MNNISSGSPSKGRETDSVVLKDREVVVGDGVDFAAAGVKDLNNFKGYHHAKETNGESERYLDSKTGAHFSF